MTERPKQIEQGMSQWEISTHLESQTATPSQRAYWRHQEKMLFKIEQHGFIAGERN
jgi:2-iminoacetate synthase ThiH